MQNNEEPFDDDDSCVPIGFTPARDDLTEWNVYSTHLELPEDFLYKGYETTVTCVHEPSAQQCDTFMIHLSDKFRELITSNNELTKQRAGSCTSGFPWRGT